MVLGSWVGDPLPVSFFFLLLFSVLFFIPYVRINARDGFGGSTLYASIPFLFFPLSLALVARVRVVLVSRECLWKRLAVSLVLPSFDDTGSLGYLPRRGIHPGAPLW